MKKILAGGFLSLIGSIWSLACCVAAGSNLVDGWSTPPGRFLTSVAQLGLTFPFVVSALAVVLGLVLMGFGLFSKEK